MTSPLRSRTTCSTPCSLSSSQSWAVRRHCQTIAGATGSPVMRSQITVVSRWLATPIAASCCGWIPDAAMASWATASVDWKISSGSWSTQPGSGWYLVIWRLAKETIRPSRLKMNAEELVVLWSIARMYLVFLVF